MYAHIKNNQSNVRTMVNLLVVSILIFGIGVNTTKVSKQFTSQPDFFQTTCQEGDNVLSEETTGIAECLALCAQKENCYTALYNRPQCSGCSNFYDGEDIITDGTTHYQWTQVCGNGWQLWNKTCYRISEPGTFQQGQAYCEKKNATAVAVETEGENEFLKQMVKGLDETYADPVSGYTLYFLGITDDCNSNRKWRQTADGKVISFQDFNNGEPNNPGLECCVGLSTYYGYKWGDITCGSQFSTICEKHLP